MGGICSSSTVHPEKPDTREPTTNQITLQRYVFGEQNNSYKDYDAMDLLADYKLYKKAKKVSFETYLQVHPQMKVEEVTIQRQLRAGVCPPVQNVN